MMARPVSVVFHLANFLIVAGPLLAVVLPHLSNPLELVVTPELKRAIASVTASGRQPLSFEFVNITHDTATRTSTLTLAVANNLGVDLEFRRLEADVRCAEHGYSLGRAELAEPVKLEASSKAAVSIIIRWSQGVEQHIRDEHKGEDSVDAVFSDAVIEIGGVTVEVPELARFSIRLPGVSP